MVQCLICQSNNKVKFLDNYKLEIKEDKKYFDGAKLYQCTDCEFSFVNPMPSEKNLNYFYKNVYRAANRPPYWVSKDYEAQKRHYLEDKNLSYLLYLTSLIDITKIKNIFDFGGGDGDLGYALKKRFNQLKLFCLESDSHCIRILNDRGYKNYENLSDIKEKFDLIITTHSLEHLTDINSVFFKFNEILNSNGYIFFEVPNCPKEYWNGRPYDGPHLLFYTRKSMEKIAEAHGFDFINFSFSAYSFADDHKYQREAQNEYEKGNNSLFSSFKFKNFIKKFIPKKIIQIRQDYLQGKRNRSETKMNWFVNNTGDNCYIRGILRKK
jgi:2-polyprenyl-3-methyl-5-hydroxy-6-metoxy-1,4-benzoquinol methylase